MAAIDAGGRLAAITEYTNVRLENGQVRGEREGRAVSLDPASLVSMNLWGFTPAAFPLIRQQLRAFLERWGADDAAEFALPDAVQEIIERGSAHVRVVPSPDAWMGGGSEPHRPLRPVSRYRDPHRGLATPWRRCKIVRRRDFHAFL